MPGRKATCAKFYDKKLDNSKGLKESRMAEAVGRSGPRYKTLKNQQQKTNNPI